MPSDAGLLVAADLLATYFLHSSLLLGTVWLTLRFARRASPLLTERTWKAAVVIPLATAPFQVFGDAAEPLYRFSLTESSQPPTLEFDDVSEARSDGPAIEWMPVERAVRSEPGLALREPSPAPPAPIEPLSPAEANRASPRVAVSPAWESREEPDAPALELPLPIEMQERPASVPEIPLPATMIVMSAASLSALGFLRLFIQAWSFRGRIAACRPIGEGPAPTVLKQLVATASLRRRVRLLESVEVGEPAAFGVLRWTIVLPEGIDQRLTPDELRALLAHELAHLARGDARWLWFGRLLCACLPIQPLNFVARRGWQAAGEFLCDDWAIRQQVAPVALAHCLTKVAEWRMQPAWCAALPAAGAGSQFSQRVERLVAASRRPDPWGGRFRRRLLPAGVALVAAIVGWLGPRSELMAEHEMIAGTQRSNVGTAERADDSVPVDESDPLADPSIPLVVPGQTAEGEAALLNHELAALRQELTLARELLRQERDDPELRLIARRIEARMNVIAMKQETLTRTGESSSGTH